MARFYANENFPLPVVQALRQLGHDVVTVQDTGKAGLAVPDQEVLGFASAEKRAVLTLNRKHFVHLHNRTRKHAGIVVCTFDCDFASQAGRIDESVKQARDLSGKLIRVNRPAG